MSDKVTVPVLPTCDVCKREQAAYDSKTRMGPWAYMCEDCWRRVGVGQLGTGYGQRLVLKGSV